MGIAHLPEELWDLIARHERAMTIQKNWRAYRIRKLTRYARWKHLEACLRKSGLPVWVFGNEFA